MKINRTAVIMASWAAVGLGGIGLKVLWNSSSHKPISFPRAQICEKDSYSRDCQRIMDLQEKMMRRQLLVVDAKDFSRYRIEQAKDYLNLAFIDRDNQVKHLKSALAQLDNADLIADEGDQFDASSPYIRDYFEVLFQMASVNDATGETVTALSILDRILIEVDRPEIRVAQQIRKYSVEGYKNRAWMEKGHILIRQRKLKEAGELLNRVAGWAGKEGEKGGFHLWLKDETPKDVRFIAAKSLLGLGKLAVASKDFTSAKDNLAMVLRVPGTGEEHGFMNVGLEALIYHMQLCRISTSNLEEAKTALRQAHIWTDIVKLPDFMDILQIKEWDISDNNIDLWAHLLKVIPRREYLSPDAQKQLLSLAEWTINSQ